MTIGISYYGIELDCRGYYSPKFPGDYLQPPEPATFEICDVYYKGVEITDLLNVFHIDWHKIEEKCLEAIE